MTCILKDRDTGFRRIHNVRIETKNDSDNIFDFDDRDGNVSMVVDASCSNRVASERLYSIPDVSVNKKPPFPHLIYDQMRSTEQRKELLMRKRLILIENRRVPSPHPAKMQTR